MPALVRTLSFWLFWVLLAQLTLPARGQDRRPYTLRGSVRAADGELLPGATVAVPALSMGVAADEQGAFALTLPAGRYRLVVSFLGYLSDEREVTLGRDQRLTISLRASGQALAEVLVESRLTLAQQLNSTQMGVERLTAREAKLLPALFGEVDILKTLQLKPGVQSGGEGSSGLFVRGGSSDQNLVLLDGALVYNPNHLFGLFSVFNSDAVQGVELSKSGFPAQFGGRLSSVVDVRVRAGSREKVGVRGGLGLISSRLTVEGPLGSRRGNAPAKGSFLLSGRRTYFDVFTRAVNRRNAREESYQPIPDYYFYDLNAKASYRLGPKDELFVTGYLGRDVFGFQSLSGFDFDFSWGNTLGVVRWQHVFTPRLTANTSVAVTDYNYQLGNRLDQLSFTLGSTIRDYTSGVEFDWQPNERHTLKLGAVLTRHRFGVGRLQAGSQDGRVGFGADVRYRGQEAAAYVSDNFRVTEKLQLEGGLRWSGFQSGANSYAGLEPRAAARYTLSPKTSLKLNYALMYQYVHLVTNTGATLPTDIWYPSRRSVKPQRAQQVSTGVNFLLGRGRFLLSSEAYYKWATNQVDFRDGAQLFVNQELDGEFLFGRGWAYGNELYLEKKEGRTTGWLGYTLAWTKRRFPPQRGTTGINRGEAYYPSYDRRHHLTAVAVHRLTKRVRLTGSFVFSSGAPTTLPLGRFAYQDVGGVEPQAVPVYPDRNTYRLIPYHRLDLGLVWQLKPNRLVAESDLSFSVYNAYSRRNAYFIFFDTVRDANEQITDFRAQQVSLFPIIPSMTYNFRF